MAQEPEKPIEKLLRSAARHRLTQAPEFKLHEVDRRLLHKEIDRYFTKRAEMPGKAPLFPRVLTRLAWASGIACVVALAFWLLNPSKPERASLAMHRESPQRKAAAAPEPVSSGEALRLKAKQAETKSMGELKLSTTLDDSATLGAERLSTPSAARRAVTARGLNNTPAKGVEESLSDAWFDEDKSQQVAAAAPIHPQEAAKPVQQPQTSPPLASSSEMATGEFGIYGGAYAAASNVATERESQGGYAYFFAQTNLSKTAAGLLENTTLGFRSLSRTNLLAHFTMHLQGGKVRIVDQDGSVYSGTSRGFTNEITLNSGLAQSKLEEGSLPLEGSLGSSSIDGIQFEVSGTNITSHQFLRFSGQVQHSQPVNYSLGGRVALKDQPTDKAGPPSLPVRQLIGTLEIGNSNVPLRATEVEE